MNSETYIALLTLAVGTLFTPGPNNAMLAASGATFGFRRTIPHLLGVALGFPLMLFCVGLFLGEVFKASWLLREVLRWGGAAILLWMAWKTAISAGVGPKEAKPHPLTTLQASAFQLVNPKGWSMAIAATAQFILPSAPLRTAAITALTFAALGFVSSASWTGLGQAFARWLTTVGRLRAFNLVMAALIVLSVVQLLLLH